MLGVRAGADELVAGGDVPERPRERHRVALVALAEGRRPDGELEIGRHVSRAGAGEGHFDLQLDHDSDDIRSL